MFIEVNCCWSKIVACLLGVLYVCGMGIESTYRVSRKDAISMLHQKRIEVFESDSNERIAYELYQAKESDFENYEVVDFDEENEPEDDKWHLWKFGW